MAAHRAFARRRQDAYFQLWCVVPQLIPSHDSKTEFERLGDDATKRPTFNHDLG